MDFFWFCFFFCRHDAAFKVKEPQVRRADRVVLRQHANELFRSGSFKDAYLKANASGVDNKCNAVGDSYNFMQLNFGIGMPF